MRSQLDVLRPRTRTRPSHYQPLPFHAIRLASLICSIIVGSIVCFFAYHLAHDGYKLPWTFFFLLAVSISTLVYLTATAFIHVFYGLSPRLNLGLNALILVLWTISLGLSSWNMSGTLGDKCDSKHWETGAGVMVCRLFKALFAFTVMGFVCGAAAVFLDFKVYRRNISRGMYGNMLGGGSAKLLQARGDVKMIEAFDKEPSGSVYEQFEPARSYEHVPAPAELYANAPYRSSSNMRAEEFGYSVPTEQTTYDAGSYSAKH
ncbi:MAG: hypothetical protein Q9227_005026 [Pyrenula ochraceoflavens]